MATELGTAYVQIIPSGSGISGSITKLLDSESKSAGTAAGKNIIESATKAMDSGGKALSAAITAPITAIGTAAVASAAGFETSFAMLSTIADTTTVSSDELRDSLMELSNQTGISAASLAEAAYSAISAGQDTANAVGFVQNASALAKAGFTDMSTATDTLTTIMNAYGLAADQVESISDKLVTTQNLGKTTVAQLGQSMGKVIPTAAMFGVNLDQLASAYVTTTKNGIATAESGTYINSMLNELGKSGTTASTALKESAGQTFTELMTSGASLTDVLGILKASADEAGVSMADMFGSAEAGKAASTLVQHAEDFDAAVTQMGVSAGTVQTAYETVDSTTATTFEKLKTNAQNTMIDIGQTILPMLVPVLETLQTILADVKEAWDSLTPAQQENIIKIAAVAAAIGPLLLAIGKVITTVKSVVGVLSVLKSAVTLLQVGALGPIVVAIMAVIAAGVLLYQNWDTVKATLQELYEIFTFCWGGMKAYFTGIVTDLVSLATSKFNEIWGIVSGVVERLKGIFNFTWHLPHIDLPHFSISGAFSLNPPSVPHLSVDWYDKGGIFTEPAVIGIAEKRPEFVGALDDLRQIVAEETHGSTVITMNVYGHEGQDVGELAEAVMDRLQAAINRKEAVFA